MHEACRQCGERPATEHGETLGRVRLQFATAVSERVAEAAAKHGVQVDLADS